MGKKQKLHKISNRKIWVFFMRVKKFYEGKKWLYVEGKKIYVNVVNKLLGIIGEGEKKKVVYKIVCIVITH